MNVVPTVEIRLITQKNVWSRTINTLAKVDFGADDIIELNKAAEIFGDYPVAHVLVSDAEVLWCYVGIKEEDIGDKLPIRIAADLGYVIHRIIYRYIHEYFGDDAPDWIRKKLENGVVDEMIDALNAVVDAKKVAAKEERKRARAAKKAEAGEAPAEKSESADPVEPAQPAKPKRRTKRAAKKAEPVIPDPPSVIIDEAEVQAMQDAAAADAEQEAVEQAQAEQEALEEEEAEIDF